ncbi:hypothetical protein [Streptomyces sp. NPDC047315]|uniref:hypothetical protein n=1 Tax=Streptomyces sp. NPDC047315 TaxID=3155142 RepID=UPI0033DCF467
MTHTEAVPLGVRVASDIEHHPNRPSPHRARVRWFDPVSTLDPYLAGWRRRVVPALGHFPVRVITNGAVDRTVHGWIADEQSRSTVKNSLAVLVRVMEQAVRDGLITVDPARVTGWQREYKQAEDELDNPRALALRDWPTLLRLAGALVARSHGHYQGWVEAVVFAAHLNPVRAPLQPHRPTRPRKAPLDRVVPKGSPRNTEKRYRISPIPPATCENTSRDDRI